MAQLTSVRPIQRGQGSIRPYKLATGQKIFAGGAVCLDGTTRLGKKAADTAAFAFVGVADKTVDNTTGPDGAKTVRVWANGVIDFACTGASQTWVGKPVYFTDDQTVALTSTNSIKAGVVTEVPSTTKVFVALSVAS